PIASIWHLTDIGGLPRNRAMLWTSAQGAPWRPCDAPRSSPGLGQIRHDGRLRACLQLKRSAIGNISPQYEKASMTGSIPHEYFILGWECHASTKPRSTISMLGVARLWKTLYFTNWNFEVGGTSPATRPITVPGTSTSVASALIEGNAI